MVTNSRVYRLMAEIIANTVIQAEPVKSYVHRKVEKVENEAEAQRILEDMTQARIKLSQEKP